MNSELNELGCPSRASLQACATYAKPTTRAGPSWRAGKLLRGQFRAVVEESGERELRLGLLRQRVRGASTCASSVLSASGFPEARVARAHVY